MVSVFTRHQWCADLIFMVAVCRAPAGAGHQQCRCAGHQQALGTSGSGVQGTSGVHWAPVVSVCRHEWCAGVMP